jgi:hypothetical protein
MKDKANTRCGERTGSCFVETKKWKNNEITMERSKDHCCFVRDANSFSPRFKQNQNYFTRSLFFGSSSALLLQE